MCIFFFFVASLSSSWVLALLTLFFEMTLLLKRSLASFPLVDRHTLTLSHAFTLMFIHSTAEASQMSNLGPLW